MQPQVTVNNVGHCIVLWGVARNLPLWWCFPVPPSLQSKLLLRVSSTSCSNSCINLFSQCSQHLGVRRHPSHHTAPRTQRLVIHCPETGLSSLSPCLPGMDGFMTTQVQYLFPYIPQNCLKNLSRCHSNRSQSSCFDELQAKCIALDRTLLVNCIAARIGKIERLILELLSCVIPLQATLSLCLLKAFPSLCFFFEGILVNSQWYYPLITC